MLFFCEGLITYCTVEEIEFETDNSCVFHTE